MTEDDSWDAYDEGYRVGVLAEREHRGRVSTALAVLSLLAGAATGVGGTLATRADSARDREVALQELQVQQRTLALETDRLRQEQEELGRKRAAFEQEERDRKQQRPASFGTPSERAAVAQAVFDDPASDAEDKDDILRELAGYLVSSSRRASPLPSVRTPLPDGTHGVANTLRQLLLLQPTNVDLSRVDLHGQYWLRGDFSRVLFVGADLRAVSILDADVVGAYFQDAELACADLQGSDLTGADLTGADLRWANLTGTDLTGVVGLDTAELTGVAYDDTTRWPASPPEQPSGKADDARTCAGAHGDDLGPAPSASARPAQSPTASPPAARADGAAQEGRS